jgi:hypothetical protein
MSLCFPPSIPRCALQAYYIFSSIETFGGGGRGGGLGGHGFAPVSFLDSTTLLSPFHPREPPSPALACRCSFCLFQSPITTVTTATVLGTVLGCGNSRKQMLCFVPQSHTCSFDNAQFCFETLREESERMAILYTAQGCGLFRLHTNQPPPTPPPSPPPPLKLALHYPGADFAERWRGIRSRADHTLEM